MHAQYRVRESLWVTAPLTLETFCNQLRTLLQLPAFEFDGENVWEWGLTKIENGFIEVNISRKLNWGKLLFEEPLIILLLVEDNAPAKYDRDWMISHLVPEFGQDIANLTKQVTYYGTVEYLGEVELVYKPSRAFQSVP